MGFSSDFVGHIDIEPPLNDSEIAYLLAFAASRRYDRGDPYEVPGNPRAELGDGPVDESYNRPPEGQPDLWCDWQVCWDGCCITWSGKEKSYAMEPWLRYVIDHWHPRGMQARQQGALCHPRARQHGDEAGDDTGRPEVRRLPPAGL